MLRVGRGGVGEWGSNKVNWGRWGSSKKGGGSGFKFCEGRVGPLQPVSQTVSQFSSVQISSAQFRSV